MADFSNSFYQRFCLCFIFVLYQHALKKPPAKGGLDFNFVAVTNAAEEAVEDRNGDRDDAAAGAVADRNGDRSDDAAAVEEDRNGGRDNNDRGHGTGGPCRRGREYICRGNVTTCPALAFQSPLCSSRRRVPRLRPLVRRKTINLPPLLPRVIFSRQSSPLRKNFFHCKPPKLFFDKCCLTFL